MFMICGNVGIRWETEEPAAHDRRSKDTASPKGHISKGRGIHEAILENPLTLGRGNVKGFAKLFAVDLSKLESVPGDVCAAQGREEL